MTVVKLAESKLLKTVIDPLVNISEEIFIEISEKGVHAQASDPGNSWAGDVFLARSEFSSIEVEDSALYCVKLKDLADFLKTAQSSEALEIRENKEKGALELKLASDQMEKRMQLRVNQIPDDFKFMQILDKTFSTNSHIQVSLFSQAIKAAELGGDQITVKINKDEIEFTSSGNTNAAQAKISFDGDNARMVNFDGNMETHESIYKLDYLKIASKVGKSGDKLKISMESDAPMRIVYSVTEDENEEATSHIAFAIAPRVTDQ